MLDNLLLELAAELLVTLRPTQKNLTSLPWPTSDSARSQADARSRVERTDRPRSPVRPGQMHLIVAGTGKRASAPGEPAAALAILAMTALILSA